HKLLYQAGFIRESSAGKYYLLPLGMRVQQKIQSVIKEEMDETGAQEMVTPVLHPIEFWKETNRTNAVGFELMKVKDRNGAEFVLGGTAEEMLVDLVRKFQISYKDLPFNLYQFSKKFRDELRARGGLLRLREFMMKDAYSFHVTEEDFKKEYEKMKKVYTRIFDRLGLKTIIVESDNGYIGGEYCHEFVVENEMGESKFLTTEDGSYAAHEDVAKFLRDDKNVDEPEKEMVEVEAVRGNTMEDGVKLHNLPLWQQIKDLMMVDEKGNMILAVIRGDLEINEVKLAHMVGACQLRHATEEEIRKIGSEPGFISPIGIKEGPPAGRQVKVIGDVSLRTIKNAYTGANKKHRDLVNVNIDRDYKLDVEGDIALAKEGCVILASEERTHPGSDSGQARMTKRLIAKRGIEVGNIFQLGYHYSSKMKDATFVDADGQKKPYYMGCYGIGLERTMAAVVEIHYDEKGIIWPASVAPYQVYLIEVQSSKFKVKSFADEVYQKLKAAGIEVLYDDREGVGAGEKFADADLIGCPVRLVVSEKTLRPSADGSRQAGDKIEWKERDKEKVELITVEEAIRRLV
ncbi:MAG: proline--tRNA ligase, partial [bacterium]|nr:proline--tRNA ligase [bacterium]